LSEGATPDCLAALSDHLASQTETSLSRAYELGRHALASEVGILGAFSLFEGALREVILTAPSSEQSRVADAVVTFFRELLSPYEMSFRGYQDANAELRRLNLELTAANAELQAKQAQLIQSAKMASLGELVAGIAHELNNPLAYVLSHVKTASANLARIEATADAALGVELLESFKRARERIVQSEAGAERIRDLVLKLRTFSRLDEGEQKTVSIRESVLSVLTILDHRMKDRLELVTAFGEPDLVECFPGLLNQAVMNLVANAIDAIDGPGTISIRTGAEGSSYAISVTDTGAGIPEHLRERVLEPFFTTKPVGQGTGLGLSISHSIAQRHGGKLELTPGRTGGTVATSRFPLVERRSEPAPSK
jgi:two-component system NtrC family sensor kinase